jgi:hypothetical protein
MSPWSEGGSLDPERVLLQQSTVSTITPEVTSEAFKAVTGWISAEALDETDNHTSTVQQRIPLVVVFLGMDSPFVAVLLDSIAE